MIRLSHRVGSAEPSATLEVAAKARELVGRGIDVVTFATGEPDFDTPRHVRKAAAEALEAGATRYPPLAGLPELRQAVVRRMEEDHGLLYSADQVLVTVGAKQAIYNLCQAVLEEGDEAVILAPYWVSYPEVVRLAGAEPVMVPSDFEDGFVPRLDRIEASLNENTRLIMLNTPSNPAGAVYPRRTLEGLADLLRCYPKVVVVTDDIYSRILFDGGSFENLAMAAPDLRHRIVIVDGVSKAFAMTGWRVGWAVGPGHLLDPMKLILGQSTSGATTFAQAGAVAALEGDQSVVDEMVAEFSRRRDHMVSRLEALEGISCRAPSGAFYALPDVRGLLGRSYGNDRVIASSGDIARLLIEEQAVAVVDGAPFGAEGFVRLSFATSMERIDEGIDRIESFVSKLN